MTLTIQRILTSRAVLSLLLLVLTAGVVFLLSGCTPASDEAATREYGQGEPAEAAPEAEGVAPAGSEVHSYDIRGEIVELPDPGDPLSGLYIHHEAVDGWVSMEGEVVGMDSMTMPFPVADDLSFEGIEAGDKVTFTLQVAYDGDPTFQVTRVEKLPDDTELDFRSARPPE